MMTNKSSREGTARAWRRWPAIWGATLLVAGVTAPGSQAQERPRGPDPEHRLEVLTEELELTAEQAASVGQILEEADAQRREVFEADRENREQLRERMMELQSETEQQLADLLTDEQMEKYRSHVEQQRRRFQRSRQDGQRRGPPPSR